MLHLLPGVAGARGEKLASDGFLLSFRSLHNKEQQSQEVKMPKRLLQPGHGNMQARQGIPREQEKERETATSCLAHLLFAPGHGHTCSSLLGMRKCTESAGSSLPRLNACNSKPCNACLVTQVLTSAMASSNHSRNLPSNLTRQGWKNELMLARCQSDQDMGWFRKARRRKSKDYLDISLGEATSNHLAQRLDWNLSRHPVHWVDGGICKRHSCLGRNREADCNMGERANAWLLRQRVISLSTFLPFWKLLVWPCFLIISFLQQPEANESH